MESMEPKKIATFDKDLDVGAGAIDAETLASADEILDKYPDELELVDYRIPTPEQASGFDATPEPEQIIVKDTLPVNDSARPYDRFGKHVDTPVPPRAPTPPKKRGFFSSLFGGQ